MLASRPVNTTGAGTFHLIPASTTQRIYVKRIIAIASAVGTVQFQDTAGNAITGSLALAAGQPLYQAGSTDAAENDGIMTIDANKGLDMVVTGAVNIGGWIQYTQ